MTKVFFFCEGVVTLCSFCICFQRYWETPVRLPLKLDTICTYSPGIDQNHLGIVSEYFSLRLAFSSASELLSLVSINSTAALSPPLAALPSRCPTPSSFPSVCTDPPGPWLPPRARHGPPSINISAGLHWRAAQFLRKEPCQVRFLRKFWEWNEKL